MMNEAQRQYYLERMGIRLWYARSSLPGAAPSPDYDFGPERKERAEPAPEPVAERSPQPTAAPVESRSRPTPKSLRALMDDQAPSQKKTPPAPAPEATSTPVETDAERAREATPLAEEDLLTLDVAICFGRNFNVMADFDGEVTGELQQRLLENILRAFEQEGSQLLRLQWPVFANPAVPGNDNESLANLMAEHVLSGIKSARWIVIGGGSEKLLSGLPAGIERTVLMSYPSSLAQLAADSSHKRSLWNRYLEQVRPALSS